MTDASVLDRARAQLARERDRLHRAAQPRQSPPPGVTWRPNASAIREQREGRQPRQYHYDQTVGSLAGRINRRSIRPSRRSRCRIRRPIPSCR